jgi:hypothetical protein
VTLRLALIVLFFSACGGSSVKHHSYAAQTLDDLAQVARETSMTERGDALRKAGLAAQAEGKDVNEAVTAAALTYQNRIDAVNGFIAAKEVYIRAVLAAISKDTDLQTILPILRKALEAYAGVQAFFKDTVPAVPSPVKEMLE